MPSPAPVAAPRPSVPDDALAGLRSEISALRRELDGLRRSFKRRKTSSANCESTWLTRPFVYDSQRRNLSVAVGPVAQVGSGTARPRLRPGSSASAGCEYIRSSWSGATARRRAGRRNPTRAAGSPAPSRCISYRPRHPCQTRFNSRATAYPLLDTDYFFQSRGKGTVRAGSEEYEANEFDAAIGRQETVSRSQCHAARLVDRIAVSARAERGKGHLTAAIFCRQFQQRR